MQRQETVFARRRAAGLTQQQLAHLARCSLAQIRRIERGRPLIRSRVLPDVLRALDRAERKAGTHA